MSGQFERVRRLFGPSVLVLSNLIEQQRIWFRFDGLLPWYRNSTSAHTAAIVVFKQVGAILYIYCLLELLHFDVELFRSFIIINELYNIHVKVLRTIVTSLRGPFSGLSRCRRFSNNSNTSSFKTFSPSRTTLKLVFHCKLCPSTCICSCSLSSHQTWWMTYTMMAPMRLVLSS